MSRADYEYNNNNAENDTEKLKIRLNENNGLLFIYHFPLCSMLCFCLQFQIFFSDCYCRLFISYTIPAILSRLIYLTITFRL